MTEKRPHINDDSSGFSRRMFMKAAGAAGVAGSMGTVQASNGDEPTDESPPERLSGIPDDLRLMSIVPHRPVGPRVDGEYHANADWGPRFIAHKPLHIEGATVDAGRSGTITVELWQFDDDSGRRVGEQPVRSREFRVTQGVQEIALDMFVEPGEYQLARKEAFPLRRILDWDGWLRERHDDIELLGAGHPSDRYEQWGDYYHYFFDLQVASADFSMPSNAVTGADRKIWDVRKFTEAAGLDDEDPCDDLLRQIFAIATTHDTVLFRDGTFVVEDVHHVHTALTIEGRNALLDFGDEGGLHFRGSHYNGADPEVTTRPTGSIRKGERSVNTVDSSGFADGDYILIETGYSSRNSEHPLQTGSDYKCQVARIESTPNHNDWFVLEQATQTRFDMDFDGGNHDIEIHRINPLNGPVFRDLETVGGEIPLRMECAVNGRFENCEVRDYENYAHRVDYCLGTVYDNPIALNPIGRASAQGEALMVAHSTNTTMNSPRVHKCRRGLDFFNGVYDVEINHPYVTGASMHAVSTHGSTASGNIYIDGGVLEADSRDGDDGEYYWGNGFSLSAECESIKVNGTTIRATRSAISGQSQALTAEGIVIESIHKEVDSGNSTLDEEPIAIRFSGGRAHITGVINDEHDQFVRVAETSGADDVRIDLAGRATGSPGDRPPEESPGSEPDDGSGSDDGSDDDSSGRSSYRIMEGTGRETTVHVYDSGEPGPTSLIVGGIHGDERSGFKAAEDIADWTVGSGTLIVLPRANVPAIQKGSRGDGYDLNRRFPPGSAPMTDLAEAIWDVVERHDPDWLIDLHSSRGYYQGSPSGVGQAIFPTESGRAGSIAGQTVNRVNSKYDLSGDDQYRVGNTLDGSDPKLVHKATGDEDIAGYIMETAWPAADPEEKATWHKTAVADALLHAGHEEGQGIAEYR